MPPGYYIYRTTPLNTHKQYSQFIKQIQSLKPWQMTTLASAICERAWPNYALFADITGFGTATDVRHCLNMVWDNAAGLQSAKNFERLLEKLDVNTPELDEFDMFGVHPALDFIVSLNCAVSCAMAMEPQETDVANVLTLSLSTIGKFIKYAEAPELKGTELTQYIEQHELNIVQLEFIEELIQKIRKLPRQNKDIVRELKTLAANDGISHLGISMD